MTGHRPWVSGREPEPDRPHSEVTIISDRNATAAAVRTRMPWHGGAITVQAAGSSKREKFDQYDKDVGVAFALARALRSTAAALELEAWERVRELGEQRAAEQKARLQRRQRLPLHQRVTSTARIREQYGDEAADRHEARAMMARLKEQS